jgi:hypothetical protein
MGALYVDSVLRQVPFPLFDDEVGRAMQPVVGWVLIPLFDDEVGRAMQPVVGWVLIGFCVGSFYPLSDSICRH